MSQPFIFGQPQIHEEPALLYVNKEPLSQKMYHRLCSNPDQAIMLYDKHNDTNTKIPSIYNGYDLTTYGISTMFNHSPSLKECQIIWNKQLQQLKTQSIRDSCIIIIESNINPSEPNIKHSLAKLLPIQYRLDLQEKLDQFASELHQSAPKTEENVISSNSVEVRNKNTENEDHLTPNTDIESENNDIKTEQENGSKNASNDELMEKQESDTEDNYKGNSLLVFSNFECYSMETMRQFVQIGQCIETLCLGIAITKYLFLSRIDKCVLILFETESDAQLIMNKMNGMRIDDVTQSLMIKFASIGLTNKVKNMFRVIDKEDMEQRKIREEEWKNKQNQMNCKPFIFGNNEEKEAQNECIENKEDKDKDKDIEQNSLNIDNIQYPTSTNWILDIKEDIESNIKDKEDIKPFVFGQKEEVKCIKKKKKRKLVASMTLKKGLMNIVSTVSKVLTDSDDNMVFNVDKDKILSFFGETVMAKYVKEMLVSQQINVWQFKRNKQWIDVDMMLSMYLNILPLNENVIISTIKSELQFDLIRTSECNGVLIYRLFNKNKSNIEYKLNRITKSMQSGVYIPSFWEKQLLNRSLSKTYLYSIDLDVFKYFGESKYSMWYKYVKQYLLNGTLVSIWSIQNWINYHSFYFYSNWKIATQNGVKMVSLWYIQGKNDVLKNGFYKNSLCVDGWQFYAKLEDAIKDNSQNRNIILCQVCIDEKQEKQLIQGDGNASCKLTNSLCAYPELCIRIR